MDKRKLERIQKGIREAKSLEDWSLCVDLCRDALADLTIDNFSEWCSIKEDLAYFLSKNRGEGKIEESIQVYEEIFSASDTERHKESRARIHVALGRLYSAKTSGDARENGEESLFHYNQALCVFTKEEHPVLWAAIKAKLGLGYVRRLAGWQNAGRLTIIKKRKEYFLQATALYEEALSVFTEDEFQEEWDELTSNILKLKEALQVLDKKQEALES